MDFYLAHDNVEAAYTLIRRVLTALIHHCKSAEQFSAVGDLLVDRLSSHIEESTHSGDEGPLNRVLGIVAVACSVRHGSRLTSSCLSVYLVAASTHLIISENHVSAILAVIPTVNYAHIHHTHILRLSTSALLAADLPLWTTHGRKILEYAQHHPTLHISLLGSLAELNWGGWKPLGHPAVLRRTPELLDAEPRAALRLLVDLHKEGKLGEVDHVWRIRMGKWVEGRLSSWERTEEKVRLLPFKLTKCPTHGYLMDMTRFWSFAIFLRWRPSFHRKQPLSSKSSRAPSIRQTQKKTMNHLEPMRGLCWRRVCEVLRRNSLKSGHITSMLRRGRAR